MKVFARINHIGWVHLWLTRESFEAGEASAHFFNGKSDPRWLEASMKSETLRGLGAGEVVEIEDPGYFSEEDLPSGAESKSISPR